MPTASCKGPTSRRPGYLPCVWLCLSFVSVMPVESGEVRVLGFWTLVRCDLLAAQPASSQRSVHAAEESFPMFLSPGARDMESGHMPSRFQQYLRLTGGRSAFVHIPKTGGTSIEQAFGLHGSVHATAMELLRQCNTTRYDRAWTWATPIRHPLDRALSLYAYTRSGGNGSPGDKYVALGCRGRWVRAICGAARGPRRLEGWF